MSYKEFLKSKRQLLGEFGFEPNYIPDVAFGFQKYVIDKAVRKGRMALFLDTGLGKTLIQLAIANNIVRKTNQRVLILTPLAVGHQFLKESLDKVTDDIEITRDGTFSKSIVLCNYERLHYLDPKDFIGIILDESSIMKNFQGSTKSQITTFAKQIKYRFASTATPAPNDYIEFGTTSEFLGYLPYMDMLERFFANNENNIRPQDIGSKWYLKPHAKEDFFTWLNQWSISVKYPSDVGFSDDKYKLPELIENKHFVKNEKNWISEDGQSSMFNMIAKTMSEVRQEQRMTIDARCEKAAELALGKTSVYWCNFNNEGDLLESIDKDAVQIKGGMSIDKKEDILLNFADGEIKRLITKPKISSFGLNWQHCNHTTFFPTWSYEQYYQALRRFWRFGQTKTVTVDLVLSDGQKRVIDTLVYKSEKAREFGELIQRERNNVLDLSKSENKVKLIKPKFI